MHVKYHSKNEFVENVCPQIRLCLFRFRLIASKQLNSLTTIATLIWLSSAEVTHPLWVWELPGSIPGTGKVFFMVDFLFWCCCALKFCNFFCNVNICSILNTVHGVWPIIRVASLINRDIRRVKTWVEGCMSSIKASSTMLSQVTSLQRHRLLHTKQTSSAFFTSNCFDVLFDLYCVHCLNSVAWMSCPRLSSAIGDLDSDTSACLIISVYPDACFLSQAMGSSWQH